MYHIKPIITSDIQVELPTSMYKMKPISTRVHSNSIHNNNLNVAGSKLADVSEHSSKEPNRDILQQINSILKVDFGFQFHSPVKSAPPSCLLCSNRKFDSVFLFQQTQGRGNEMEELEARQEVILQHLKELKERLMSMHKELKICGKPGQQPARVQHSEQTRIAQKPIDVREIERERNLPSVC